MNEKATLAFKFNATYRKNNFNGPTTFLDGLTRIGNPLHAFCSERKDSPHGRIFYKEFPVGDNMHDVYIKGVISFVNNTFDERTAITPDARITDLIGASWLAMHGTHITMLEKLTLPASVVEILGEDHTVRHF